MQHSCRWIKEKEHETLEIDLKGIKISCLCVLVWITLYYTNCILRVNLLSFKKITGDIRLVSEILFFIFKGHQTYVQILGFDK